jgi:hypothetical protein
MITSSHLWGESWDIYRDKQVWVVGFRGLKGGKSSRHLHRYMAHTFYVTSGYLVIEDFEGYEPQYVHQYGDDSDYRIAFCDARQQHQLRFAEDTEGIETYYALPGHEIDPNDIVRLSPGRAPDAAPA